MTPPATPSWRGSSSASCQEGGGRYRTVPLKDAVLVAHDRNPDSARSWVRAESIMARERQGESAAQ